MSSVHSKTMGWPGVSHSAPAGRGRAVVRAGLCLGLCLVVVLGAVAPAASADDGSSATPAVVATPAASGDDGGTNVSGTPSTSDASGTQDRSPTRGDDSPGLLALMSVVQDPGKFIVDGLQKGVLWLFGWSAEQLHDAIASVCCQSVNFFTQTPPTLSYASPAVRGLWGTVRAIANAGLVLAAAWGAFTLIVRGHLGSPYHEALELFPRLALGALLVNTSHWWTQLAIDANNTLCHALGQTGLPGWDTANGQLGQPAFGVIIALVYFVMGLILLLQQLARLALVDVLLVLAPLGLVCWVLPSTQQWARLWSDSFFGAVFTQFVQVVALKVGAALIADYLTIGPSDTQVLSLFLAIAVLVLAVKVPSLMRAAGGIGGGIGFVRYYAYRSAAKQFGLNESAASARSSGATQAVQLALPLKK